MTGTAPIQPETPSTLPPPAGSIRVETLSIRNFESCPPTARTPCQGEITLRLTALDLSPGDERVWRLIYRNRPGTFGGPASLAADNGRDTHPLQNALRLRMPEATTTDAARSILPGDSRPLIATGRIRAGEVIVLRLGFELAVGYTLPAGSYDVLFDIGIEMD
jgi:hypothetical protein